MSDPTPAPLPEYIAQADNITAIFVGFGVIVIVLLAILVVRSFR